jgi:chorismate mutase
MSDRFDELRRDIAANDERIVDAVNRRLRLIIELWEIKRERGLDRVDAGREQALRDSLAASNGGPLSSAGLDELITALLELTKRELP